MTNKEIFKTMFFAMILELKKEEITMTKPGSIDYLLFGSKPSRQSINIKIGNRFEKLLNEFSRKMGYPLHNLATTLIKGHQIDTLIEVNGVLEYEEQKTNAGLDSEKIKATINKINEICEALSKITKKKVKGSIFHTSVWEYSDATTYNSYYERYRKGGVSVKFMSDYFLSLGVDMSKEEYHTMWGDAGKMLS